MRRVTPGVTKPVNRVPYGERVCAVETDGGFILKADTSIRVGDPIIGPDNIVHWVQRVIPRHADKKKVVDAGERLWDDESVNGAETPPRPV